MEDFSQYISSYKYEYSHDIKEPQVLEKGCPVENGRHEDGRESHNSLGPFSSITCEILARSYESDPLHRMCVVGFP